MQCSVDKECGLKSQGGDNDEGGTKAKEPSPKGVRFVADATVEPSAEEVAEPTEAPEPTEASGSGAGGAGDEAAAILAAAQDATAAVANAEGADAGEEDEEEDVPVTGFGKARNSMWTGNKKCRKGGGDKLDLDSEEENAEDDSWEGGSEGEGESAGEGEGGADNKEEGEEDGASVVKTKEFMPGENKMKFKSARNSISCNRNRRRAAGRPGSWSAWPRRQREDAPGAYANL